MKHKNLLNTEKKNPDSKREPPPQRPSDEERALRFKQSIESTPPEVRAARTELFRAMREE